MRPFWPFWEKWYSWDIVFIIEPCFSILLIGGLVLPGALLADQRRDRSAPQRARRTSGGVVALLGVISVWGVRDYEHRRAVNALNSRLYDGADPVRVSAYPNWLNPFQVVWRGRDPELLRHHAGGFFRP